MYDLIPCPLGEPSIVSGRRSAEGSPSYSPLSCGSILFALACGQTTWLFATGVSEQFSRFAHPWAAFGCAVAFVLTCRLTATVSDPALERAALKALLDALRDAQMTHKEACALMAIAPSQWSEILNGQRHTPSHSRLLNLPWTFWQSYLPKLASVLVTHKLHDMVSDHHERRMSA